jgi:enoyl-CoA hydratase
MNRYEALKVSMADGIVTVTLSNPPRKNAINSQTSRELTLIWDDLADDPAVKVIIFTGEGDNFCAGADFSGERPGEAWEEGETKPVSWVTRAARKHVYGIMECEKPVIAKVRGVAYGMGVSMALACDMVFASPEARFCDSHVKVGLAAGDGGVMLWPLLVGFHRAKEYLMTGTPVGAEHAERIGLINRCVPAGDLDAAVQQLAETLRDMPPHAVNYTKMALNAAMKQMGGAAFEASLGYELYTMGMEDYAEAATAFLEKRKGVFKGK